MPHETDLISLIAVGFVLALVFGTLAQAVRLPPLVGYLLAGVCIGPFTPGFVGDSALAQQLAELGVILLMFGVGLHFSLDTLWEQRRIALPGAVVQIAVATAIGASAARAWGWSLEAGLVLGLALSVASTVVLLRALEQRQELNTGRGRIAVAWLIVEDLATVLALVFLPALASGGEGAGEGIWRELGLTVLKLALFMAAMLLGGRRVVPWMLRQVARTGSRELFTLSVLAIALGIAYGSAVLFDVSFALGAFFAGVMLAESDLSHDAAEKSLPLQDAFAVLFFISVGMLFDPAIVVREPLAVLTVLFVVVVGKSLAAFAIVLAFAHPVRTALTISASLAQVGEFSFILAGLGVALGLMPEAGRDLILAGALLSITLNPLVFATIGPVERLIEARPRLHAALTRKHLHQEATARPPAETLAGHAIVVGYGRVGSEIGAALREAGVPHAVIELNPRIIERALAPDGIPAVNGDASAPGVLEAAGIATARLLVIATPDSFYARRVLELAQRARPDLPTVVRTHHADERARLEAAGATHVVMGEHELALAMSRYSLQELQSA